MLLEILVQLVLQDQRGHRGHRVMMVRQVPRDQPVHKGLLVRKVLQVQVLQDQQGHRVLTV